MPAKGAQRHSWTACLAIGLCPLFLRIGWTPSSGRFTQARLAFRRAPPLFEAAPALSFAVFSLVPAAAGRLHDDNQPKLRLAACLFVPRRGGARAEIVACRAGLCPPLRNRALGRPISPWGDISLRLPPSSLSPAGAGGMFGSSGKTQHATPRNECRIRKAIVSELAGAVQFSQ